MNRVVVLCFALILTLSILIPSASEACLDPAASPATITLVRLGGSSGVIIASGYETFGSTPGQFCGCGFAPADSACVSDILSATVVLAGTTTPLAEFSFSSNGNTTGSFAAVAANPYWKAFSSSVSSSVPAGTAVDIRFAVVLNPACSNNNVLNSLDGANGAFIGTDETSFDGLITGNHLSILGPTIPAIPTLSEWGLILLAVTVLSLGVWRLRRRHVNA